jgi:hypothetical protein
MATGYFEEVIPLNFTRGDCREGVKLISKTLARTGITSAPEAQGVPEDLRAYQMCRRGGTAVPLVRLHQLPLSRADA